MKKNKKRDEFLEHLRSLPIILVAAEKSGLSRQTIYRWKSEDEEFCKEMDKAMKEGEEFVNDMSESQLLTMIKEKNWSAISFWLRHHHTAYRNRVEIATAIPQEELTPEQEEVVREALRLATLPINSNDNENINENNEDGLSESANDSIRTDGEDAKGSDNQNSDNQV